MLVKKQSRLWYPILFGLYPVLTFLASNVQQIYPGIALRAVALGLIAAVLLYGLLRLVLGNWPRAALVSSLLAAFFYSYGHLYSLIENKTLFGLVVGRHRILVVVYLLILGAAVYLALARAWKNAQLHQLLNFIAVVLVALPLLRLGAFAYNFWTTESRSRAVAQPAAAAADANAPDVYFIILDSYARDDVLQKEFQLDNTALLQQLQQMGFVIPACAQSNYAMTSASLPATLNMQYLEQLPEVINPDGLDYTLMGDYIQHSAVRQHFKDLGYQMVAFESGVWWAETTDADVYISRVQNPMSTLASFHSINQFEDMFLRTTAFRILSEAQTAYLDRFFAQVKTPEQDHYERVLFVTEQAGQVPLLPGKKFAFLHLVAPHPPYVFSPDGSFQYSEELKPGYPDELVYLNQLVVPMLRKILENSSRPPVIILQADHGVGENRMPILSAYYLPDGGDQSVYAQLTPVNNFRLIFDYYFQGHYGLLKDVSYDSIYKDPFNFTIVPATCSAIGKK